MTDSAAPTPLVTHVNLAEEFQNSGVAEILEELDQELVGLRPVKQRIREIAALLIVERARKSMGLAHDTPTLHMSFTGNPGTGKTTVALKMAGLLHRLGYVRKGHLVSVTRDDLVGQYIGHTAPKTKDVLKSAMGGVLFIDEAYYLYRPDNERDYGQEAIEILLQVMENNRDDLVVILAGYADRMDKFFSSNPGLSFPHRPSHRLSRLFRRRAALDRGQHARRSRTTLFDRRGQGRRWPSTSRAAASSRTSPMPARSATRSIARVCGRPTGCSSARRVPSTRPSFPRSAPRTSAPAACSRAGSIRAGRAAAGRDRALFRTEYGCGGP